MIAFTFLRIDFFKLKQYFVSKLFQISRKAVNTSFLVDLKITNNFGELLLGLVFWLQSGDSSVSQNHK